MRDTEAGVGHLSVGIMETATERAAISSDTSLYDGIKVVHVVPSFFPATQFGGPIISVYELCNHLAKNAGVRLRVLTTDTAGHRSGERLSISERKEAKYEGYPVHFSRKLVGTAIAPTIWTKIWAAVGWADVVHLTGVYSFPTLPTLFAARVLRKPLVWSPRGALKEWARTQNKLPKTVWRKICRTALLPSQTLLHVTSSEEEAEAKGRMSGVRCVLIPNGVEIPQLTGVRDWIPNGELRLLYLGRLDPIKGLENLIQALRHLKHPQFSLKIYGGGDDRYVRSLESLATKCGVRDKIALLGPAAENVKRTAFLSSDICVVPSHSENFGMVVAEALAHGTPVVASTGTPWQMIEDANVGRWVANDPESLATAIDSVRRGDLVAMSERARAMMKSSFAWPSVAARMLDTYKALRSSASKRTYTG